MAARHFKYTYNSEMPPKTVLSKMLTANIDDNYKNLDNKIDLNIEKNRRYFNRRKELKNLMKSVNSHIDNNSQSLFLTLYYMDLIFTHKDLEKVFYSHFYTWNAYGSLNDFQMNNYVLLSLACLIVASKFNENDPHVPTISSYIRLLYEYSKKKYIFNLYSLYMAEVVVVKLLKYKLNYYTIYHYLIFFFTHGIIFKKTIENSKIFKKYSERKILEKIYIQAREMLDGIIDSEKYYDLYFGKDNYIVVIEILLWSIEHVMNIKLKDDENIFKLVFNLTIDENIHKKIYGILEEIYNNIKKKINSGNKNNRIPLNNTNQKIIANYTKESESESSTSVFSSRPINAEINFQFIEPKYSVPNSYSNVKPYYVYSSKEMTLEDKDKNFQAYNGLIHNNLEGFNSNYGYKISLPHHIQHQSIGKNDNFIPKSNISYGQNKRIYLTSNKNVTSNYHLNSAENNIPKIMNNIKDENIKPFNIEKEPIDSVKSPSLNNNSNAIKNNNNSDKMRKKSSSCSKNNYNYNVPYIYNPKESPASKLNNNFKFEENINNTQILTNTNKINNYYYNYTSNKQFEDGNIIKIEKDKYYNKYQPTNNNNSFYPNKSFNPHILIDKAQPIINNELQKNLFNISKINTKLELEPRDNNRHNSINKYYIDSGIKGNKNNNKANTIIINNNIHINTFIDKNNMNLDKKEIIKGREKNVFLYNRTSEKNVREMYNETNLNKNCKNIRNKQKLETEIKSCRNKANKSSIVFSHI